MADISGKLLTVEEFAARTGKSARTVFRYVSSGRLSTVTLTDNGRQVVRIPEAEVARFSVPSPTPWQSQAVNNDSQAAASDSQPIHSVTDMSSGSSATADSHVGEESSPQHLHDSQATAMVSAIRHLVDEVATVADKIAGIEQEVRQLRPPPPNESPLEPGVTLMRTPPPSPPPPADPTPSVDDLVLAARYGALRERYQRLRKKLNKQQLALTDGRSREAELVDKLEVLEALQASSTEHIEELRHRLAEEAQARQDAEIRSQESIEAQTRSRQQLEEQLRATQDQLQEHEARRRQEAQQAARRVPWWKRLLGSGPARA